MTLATFCTTDPDFFILWSHLEGKKEQNKKSIRLEIYSHC